jgi:MFS family permease
MAVEVPTVGAVTADGSAGSSKPWPKPAVAWYAVVVFSLVLMFGQLDQGIISLLFTPIKRDFHLLDWQISMLTGLAPVLFYAFIGVPISRFVDRGTRKYVLAAGIGISAVLTSFCGLAQNFWQLFVCRVAVGGGNAVNGPGTYSMMADFFPREKLPRAIAIIQIGFISGTATPLILGAFVIGLMAGVPEQHFLGLTIRNWQMVFIGVGVPSVLGALLLLTVPEPPRRGSAAAGQKKVYSLMQVVGYLFQHWRVYAPMFFGLAMSAVETYGVQSWRPAFFQRTYGWTAQQAGYTIGVTVFFAQLLGLAVGAVLTEYLAKRHDDANVRVVAIMYTITPIFAILGPLSPNPWLAVAAAAMTGMCGLAAAVPQNAAIQNITPHEMRGQVTALYLFVFTVIGQGGGPIFIALITNFIIHDESQIRWAMSGSAAVMNPLAALIIWLGVGAYGKAIAQIKAREAIQGA